MRPESLFHNEGMKSRGKNTQNTTTGEELRSVLQWAEKCGLLDVSATLQPRSRLEERKRIEG